MIKNLPTPPEGHSWRLVPGVFNGVHLALIEQWGPWGMLERTRFRQPIRLADTSPDWFWRHTKYALNAAHRRNREKQPSTKQERYHRFLRMVTEANSREEE